MNLFGRKNPIAIQRGNVVMTLEAAEKEVQRLRERREFALRLEALHQERADKLSALALKLEGEGYELEDLIEAARDQARRSA
jgi:hypothetical protein